MRTFFDKEKLKMMVLLWKSQVMVLSDDTDQKMIDIKTKMVTIKDNKYFP